MPYPSLAGRGSYVTRDRERSDANHSRKPVAGGLSCSVQEGNVEPTWHDGLSRKALVELVEGLLLAVDKAIPRIDAVAHHLSLMAQQGEEYEVLGGIGDQIADLGDELYSASDRDKLREWGNEIDTPEKAH